MVSITNNRQFKHAFVAIILSTVFLSCLVSTANAQSGGTLFLSPGTGVYTANGVFNVRVMVNTGGSAINAAEGTLGFNIGQLRVVSVSQAGSIFNLWTVEPEFSNTAGTIRFGGGSPKGYTGSSGHIFTVTFRALRESTTEVNFSSGVILAADGKGTNIVSTLSGGSYTITSETTLPEPEYVAPDNTPDTPNVSSPTHPDGTKWYQSQDVEFAWTIPDGVTNVRLTADERRSTIPAVFYDTPIEGRVLEGFDEGAWFLHVQFRNEHGWGKIAHFPFNIDATKPESFTITRVLEIDPTDPRVTFLFEAVDAVSGVSDYEIQIDGDEILYWQDDGTGMYKLDAIEPGAHTMVVRALDKAGNSILESITFTVESLGAPIITDYPEELASGSILVVRGTAIPESEVTVFIAQRGEEPETYTVTTDEDGGFTFIMDEKPKDGVYTIWATVVDVRGAQSGKSNIITVAVHPAGFIKIGGVAISYLSVIIPLLALIIAAVLLLFYGRKKVVELRRAVRKEATEAEEVLHESFTKLHFEVEEHVKSLEEARKRRELSREEEKLIRDLRKGLDEAEKVVGKEIRDIKRIK